MKSEPPVILGVEGGISVELSLSGADETIQRFRRYMASNPAARYGWVEMSEGAGAIQVSDDYVEPFREIAANFGLEVQDRSATDRME